jgi:hypothetical protein
MNKRIRKKRLKKLNKEFVDIILHNQRAMMCFIEAQRIINIARHTKFRCGGMVPTNAVETIIPAITNESILSPEDQERLFAYAANFADINEQAGVTMEVT